MELIYITSQNTYYNLARLLRMRYKPSKDRKRTGKFTSTSHLVLAFSTEPLDAVHLTGEEADKVYENIISMSPLTKST
jgi:hypothetical protein